MSSIRRLLVTGGAGFIGSNFVRRGLAGDHYAAVTVLDRLTYAGNLANLSEVAGDPRFRFVQGDIADASLVDTLAAEVDAIVNFAAESHVDRSIEAPDAFVRTSIYGSFVLLEAARHHGHVRYLQVSTDEVYGTVPVGSSTEDAPLRPRSPYAAAKAGADLLALAYHVTHGLPVLITRGSNTFGPYQHPEKMIPLFVTNAIDSEPLPLYGDGGQIRDWLFVDDHCDGIAVALERGQPGEAYNIAGGNELPNLEVTATILDVLGKPRSLIRHVEDRRGHDRRYSVDSSKLRGLGWRPMHRFEDALRLTVRWYVEGADWWRPLKGGEYLDYYRRQYAHRLAVAMPEAATIPES